MNKKLATSFLWDFVGKMSHQIITFIIGVILARLLSPKEYGLVGIALVFIVFSSIFSNLGLNSSLIQRKKVDESHYSSAFFLNVLISFLLALLLFFSSNLIANFFSEPELVPITKVLGLGIIISSFSIVQESILRRNMRFDILSKAKVYSAIIAGIVGVSLALLKFGVWSLVVQYLINILSKSFFYWIYSDWKPKLLFRINSLKELWSFGFSMFLSSFIYTGFNQVSSIVIAKIFSSQDLGLFSRAKTLNEFVYRYSSESISAVTFSKMSKMQQNKKKLIDLGLKAETLISFATFGLLGLMYVTSEPLILMLLGQKWVGAIEIYELLCFSGFVYPISVATLSMLKASGFSKTNLKLEIIKTFIATIGLVIGFSYGLKGYLTSLIFTGIITVYLNMKFTSNMLNYSLNRHLKPILSYLIIAVFTTFLMNLIPISFSYQIVNLISYAFVYVFVYLFLNFIFKTEGLFLARTQMLTLFDKKEK